MKFFIVTVGLLAGCLFCSEQSGVESGPALDAQRLVAPFFEQNLIACQENRDCVTGLCDKTPFFAVSDLGGYCLAFPNAFERWQRVWLARRLGESARGDAQVASQAMERIERELGQVFHPAEREILVLLLSELGTPEALARLEQAYAAESGGIKQLCALKLAQAGREQYSEQVVEAALSSTVRLRMHAASAAGGLCNGPALGALQELIGDVNVQVRQAAAQALAGCRGETARKALARKLEENQDDFSARPGDRFLFGAALKEAGNGEL